MTTDIMTNELTEKYRPHDFHEVIGQGPVVDSLQSILARKDEAGNLIGVPHAFLFTGHYGCGKTTLAMIVKDELGCADRDFEYFNTSNTRGIDTIREIDRTCRYKPIAGKVKFIILDECHKLTNEAQNALLNLLESPPAHTYFALCTTEPVKLLKTIVSRCVPYQLKALKRIDIYKLLKSITIEEKVDIPSDLLKEIARVSNGSARDAVKKLDQIIDIDDDDKARQAISEGAVQEADIIEISRILIDTKMGVKAKWNDISDIMKRVEAEPEDVRRHILKYLNTVLLNDGSDRVAELMSLFFDTTFYTGQAGLTYELYLACKL